MLNGVCLGLIALFCEEDPLLNLRSQQRQIHDLRDPRSAQPRQTSDLSVVLHEAMTDELLEVVAENQKSRELRDRIGRLLNGPGFRGRGSSRH